MSVVSQVRDFNRFYTRQIGLLDEHMPRSPYSLQESRLVYEIATRGHGSAAEIARDLGLDPGYLSRMLQKLLAEELIALTPSLTDRRRNEIALTAAGERLFTELDVGSEAAIGRLLEPLDDGRRTELVTAMRAVRRLLGDQPQDAAIVLRQHKIGELGWLISRQGLLYHQQLGWNGEFEDLIAKIYADYAAAPDSPPKALWVADRDGAVMGSIFVLAAVNQPDTAQLRMLYVEPEARGKGLGATLVRQAVTFARESGYRRMRLWTQSALVSARRIYQAQGFGMVASARHRSFGVDLVGEHWELELSE
jgi:DNA-binding MarR family transcriptional regulator/GNAT superfamily N-acetyltransferase